MPTGYTAPVKDGEITDLKDFAAMCARGFGAFIHQRDDRTGSKLTYPRPESFYRNMLSEAVGQRVEWEAMSEEERYAKWSQYYLSSVLNNAKYLGKKRAERARYEAMLTQVNTIDVPEELENFKTFMVEQLESSIDFDCSEKYMSHMEPLEYSLWCDEREESTARNVERYEEEANNEYKRFVDRVKFIDLMKNTYGFEVYQ